MPKKIKQEALIETDPQAPVEPPAKKPRQQSSWFRAAQECGYMKKGEGFKPLPKKDSDEYKAIKKVEERLKKEATDKPAESNE